MFNKLILSHRAVALRTGGLRHAVALRTGGLRHAVALRTGGLRHAVALRTGGLRHAVALCVGGSLFLCCFATMAFADSISPADLKALLARIREQRAAAPQVQADFQEEKSVHLLNKPISSSGKMWFQAPNKFRREAKGNSPSITVSDGQHLWIYYPKFKSAEHYTLGKRSPLDAGIAAITASLNLENVEATYNIAATRAADGYQLQLTPRNPSMKRLLQSFGIRMNNEFQVVRTEMLQPNGDRIVTTYANESRAAIPASTFEFTPPAGTDVSTPLGR